MSGRSHLGTCRAGKSHRELVELEEGIQQELDSGTAADPEFMSAVLKRLTLHKAKARLKDIHAGLMAKHAERIIATQDPSMDIRKAMGWQVDEVGLTELWIRTGGLTDPIRRPGYCCTQLPYARECLRAALSLSHLHASACKPGSGQASIFCVGFIKVLCQLLRLFECSPAGRRAGSYEYWSHAQPALCKC